MRHLSPKIENNCQATGSRFKPENKLLEAKNYSLVNLLADQKSRGSVSVPGARLAKLESMLKKGQKVISAVTEP